MRKISLTPAVWRAVTGLCIGIVATWLGVMALAAGKMPEENGFLEIMAHILIPPVYGLLLGAAAVLPISIEQFFFPVIIIFFYPTLLALAFFIGGEKQTRRIIIAEAILITGFLLLAGAGYVMR